MLHLSAQSRDILDAVRMVVSLYAAFRILHGMKVGIGLAAVVLSAGLTLFAGHTPPGHGGPDEASWTLAVGTGFSLLVLAGHWLDTGTAALAASISEFRASRPR